MSTVLGDALSGNPRPVPLTETELVVMEHVVQGYDNKQIAAALGNAPVTIGQHLTVIRVKLKARSRSRATLIAAYLATRKP